MTNIQGYYSNLLDKVNEQIIKLMDNRILRENIDVNTTVFYIQYDNKYVLVWT